MNLLISSFSSKQQQLFYLSFSKYLHSPQLEIFLGITLGSDIIKRFSRFNDVMLSAGLMHAIVASGYNINLVFTFLFVTLGSKFKIYYLIVAQVIALIYACLTGFNIPIIRAVLMVSAVYWSRYLGYKIAGVIMILKVTLWMLVLSPRLYLSLSFIYTVGATFGLALSTFLTKNDNNILALVQESLMAQIFIFPVSFIVFGSLNVFSILSTVVLGPLISLIAIFGFIAVLTVYIGFISPYFILIVANISCSIFVYLCEILGNINTLNVYVSLCILLAALYILLLKPNVKFLLQKSYER